MPRAKALKVTVSDRAGLLGEITSVLGRKGINIRAMHGYVEQGEGVLCLVVDKLAAANRVLASRGFQPTEEEVLELELVNKPGALGLVSTVSRFRSVSTSPDQAHTRGRERQDGSRARAGRGTRGRGVGR